MGDAGGVSLPVFLHDGETEISIGTAVVHPFLKFNHLQSAISQRIGLSPNQISIYLAERRLYRSWPRKVPLTAKFNFATITGGKDLYFMVFLRRSRARGKAAKQQQRLPENVMLLRREAEPPADHLYGDGYGVPVVDPYEYDRRVIKLAADREKYIMMNSHSHNNYAISVKVPEVFCEECERSKESELQPEFHWCQNDAMVSEFRSRAGPVCRPGNGRGAAGESV